MLKPSLSLLSLCIFVRSPFLLLKSAFCVSEASMFIVQSSCLMLKSAFSMLQNPRYVSLPHLLFVHGQLIGLEFQRLSVIVAGEAPHDVSRWGLLGSAVLDLITPAALRI